ncbi:hypothetical protein ACFL45_02330 [Candidatus Neomarinimicrobiota bacterium]
MTKLNEQVALSILFANTKRKRRTADLIRIAEACEFLIKLYGSQKAVAQKVGVSPEIIREFKKLLALPPEVKDMVRGKKIDSLDIAYRISMLKNKKEQIELAQQVAELHSKDVRDIKRLITRTGLSAKESRRKVLDSKLKGLHVFMMDFNDEEYHAIIKASKRKKIEPAELVKQIILDWLRSFH